MESFNDFRSPVGEEPEYPTAEGIEVEEEEIEEITLESKASDDEDDPSRKIVE